MLEQSNLGTVFLTFITFLILREENTNLMLRFLQYHLGKVPMLHWAKLDKRRYGSLEYMVQIPSVDQCGILV